MILARNRRRGAILPLVAISMISLLGITGLVIDGGFLLKERRLAQNAADAGAIAGSLSYMNTLSMTSGAQAAFEYAFTNMPDVPQPVNVSGFTPNTTQTVGQVSVTVNIPPKSGNNISAPNAVEVIVESNLKTIFMGVVGSSSSTAAARAVAISTPFKKSIVILNPTMQAALEIRGNVNVQNGGQIFSYSNNTTPNDAASQGATGSIFVGSNSTLSVTGVNVISTLVVESGSTVSFVNSDGSANPTGSANVIPAPPSGAVLDPFGTKVSGNYVIPDPQTITNSGASGLTSQGSLTVTTNSTIQPGIYNNLTIGSSRHSPAVTMAPGMYYIKPGGEFNLTAGSLTGTGVTIVNDTQNDYVFGWDNPANGPISITPPTASTSTVGTWPTGTTNNTYAGFSMWVPRSWNQEVHFQDSYNVTMPGMFYAAGAEYDIRANNNATFNVGGYVADLGEWNQKYGGGSGTGTGTINISPPNTPWGTSLVE